METPVCWRNVFIFLAMTNYLIPFCNSVHFITLNMETLLPLQGKKKNRLSPIRRFSAHTPLSLTYFPVPAGKTCTFSHIYAPRTFQPKKINSGAHMPCLKPLLAWRSNSKNVYGKIPMVFSIEKGIPGTEMELPCGQCSGCRLDYARQWAVRCCHEAQLHDQNCFLTLTYREAPYGLQPADMRNFLKRIRKHLEPKKIRFFQVGEYGDQSGRPHHHCLLFGHDFDDKLLIRRGEYPLYQSATLDRLWGHGFASIGELTFDSACYCARYILKKITGDIADDHYQGKKPEYTTMSRRPGIGSDFYHKFKEDLYNHDRCVITDKFLCKPPRFYDHLFETDNPDRFNIIKEERRKKALENPENSPERRKVKEELIKIRQKQIGRSYENAETNVYDS